MYLLVPTEPLSRLVKNNLPPEPLLSSASFSFVKSVIVATIVSSISSSYLSWSFIFTKFK
jgi:hypothetical protein